MEEAFLGGLTGRIVIPSDPDYNLARQGWNHAVQNYPLIINYCQSQQDVRNAVLWSVNHSIPLRVRSGGHNYEGYSNGNCVLVIDLSEMNSITLEEEKNLLHIQGGVTNRLLYDFVSQKGYPFPGGTCPTVGVSGYASGGGWGLSCRYLGLGCDSLEEFELVDYRGTVLKANEDCNSDLFWACRGAGGGNFGVITSMTFQLPKKTRNITLIEIDYLHVDSLIQERFLKVWQNWQSTADNRMTLLARIYHTEADGPAMLVRGFFYGKPAKAKEMLKPFLLLPNAVNNIEYVTFLEAVTIIGSFYPPFEKFQAVSGFVFQDFVPSERAQLVSLIEAPAPGSVFTGLSLYALGGKVSETGTNDTAFFYRKARYILWLETIWEDDRYACYNRNWIACRYPEFNSLTTGSYVNFPYSGLYCYKKKYFGGHVRPLEEIKLKYDPGNVFTFPQGLFPSGNSPFEPVNNSQNPLKDISWDSLVDLLEAEKQKETENQQGSGNQQEAENQQGLGAQQGTENKLTPENQQKSGNQQGDENQQKSEDQRGMENQQQPGNQQDKGNQQDTENQEDSKGPRNSESPRSSRSSGSTRSSGNTRGSENPRGSGSTRSSSNPRGFRYVTPHRKYRNF